MTWQISGKMLRFIDEKIRRKSEIEKKNIPNKETNKQNIKQSNK